MYFKNEIVLSRSFDYKGDKVDLIEEQTGKKSFYCIYTQKNLTYLELHIYVY